MDLSQQSAIYGGIRYAKIGFEIEFIEDTEMVREKASAIRGGIGEMLLRTHCISTRKCENCGFTAECLVQRIMYSKFENIPKSMHEGDSVGYIIFCPDKRKRYQAGERLEFSLTLIGKTIVYFSQYLNALYALGMEGIGRNKSRFVIVAVKNLFGKPILDENNIYMEHYKWQNLEDYVQWRKHCLTGRKDCVQLAFQSPLSLKYQGEFVEEFLPEALVAGIVRRLNILSTFEGLNDSKNLIQSQLLTEIPVNVAQEVEKAEVPRYSSRKDKLMYLKGIRGKVILEHVTEEWLNILLAGEIVHIGKCTSFGFGRYKLIPAIN